MDFLGGDPEDILVVGLGFGYGFVEFGVGERVDGGVVVEFVEESVFFLHLVIRKWKLNS